jgi:hypothetical protein
MMIFLRYKAVNSVGKDSGHELVVVFCGSKWEQDGCAFRIPEKFTGTSMGTAF